MKISIIVTYHGEERYLNDCLESLEEQTFRDFQVILVSDHCQAELPEVTYDLLSYELTEGSGVAAARNFGLRKAEGEFVYFLDCDDYIESDALEKLLEEAGKAEEEADIVYGKRHKTWYKRQVYYEKLAEMEAQEDDSEDDIDENQEEYPEEIEDEDSMAAEKKWWKKLLPASRSLSYVSVLSILFRREYLVEKDIWFDEDLTFMSDYPFLVKALAGTSHVIRCSESIYIKRKHNDPINLPSLSQNEDKNKRIHEGLRVYLESVSYVDEIGQFQLGKQIVQYMVAVVGTYMRKCEDEEERQEIFSDMVKVANQLPKEVIAEQSMYRKKLLRHIKNNRCDKLIKALKNRNTLKTLKRITRSRAALKKFVYRMVFTKMKLMENTVLLESFFGKSYSDSPKYLFEYLNEHYPGKYKFVWILNSKKKLPYPAKQIKRFSFKYYYYMGRAKYIAFNSRQPVHFIKREGNVFLEFWHGTPLKKLVFDMEEVTSASPLYKKHFYKQMSSWDYLVAPNEFSAQIFKRAFMYEGPMLRTGYPRNDILYREDKEELAAKIKDKLSIPKDKKIILYAPTWRDDEYYGPGQYKFTLKLELDKMQKRLGDEWVVVLRTHYFVADSLDVSEYGDFVFNMSKYDDIAELYLISDVLITDYSSVFFDYANLRRPMLFFTYDLEKYRDVLRGFYIDMEEEIPGPLLFNTEEVIDAIENLSDLQKEYEDKYKLFCDKFCDFENGTATEQIVNEVFR